MKTLKTFWVAVLAVVMIGSTIPAAHADFIDDVIDGIGDGIRDHIRDELRNRPGADGRQRLVLHLGDAHYRGDNTIFLRRELNAQYPHLRLQGADLLRVRVVGKSRHGRGQASLEVGGYEVDRATLGGVPADFHNDVPYTFSRVDLMNNYDSRGPWQIKLRGNIKVRRVVVIVQTRGGSGPGRTVSVECSSWGNAYATCAAGGRIQSIQVQRQHSNSPCIQGRTFGIAGNQIWVDRGCRATFLVSLGRR